MALPALLLVVLIVLGMLALALFVNPGKAPAPAIAGRSYWYSSLAMSDHRVLAVSSRWIGRGHRAALTAGRRGVATANWLLGR